MKRQTQTTGIRFWYGDDLLSLQNELYKVLDGFFGQFGAFVLEGCEVKPNGTKYDISRGLMALSGTDAEGRPTRMVVPFEGVQNVSLPVYFTLGYETVTRTYKDGTVKPVSFAYKATASTVQPAGECLTVSQPEMLRFADVIQDRQHTFVTEEERRSWNSIIGAAKSYAEALHASAKSYADNLVARLVDQSPESLDTFRKLADALGNDPAFATTILEQLGQKTQALTPYKQIAHGPYSPKGGDTVYYIGNYKFLTVELPWPEDFTLTNDKAVLIVSDGIEVEFNSSYFVNRQPVTPTGGGEIEHVYTIRCISSYAAYPPFQYYVDHTIYERR